jgi:hypothetical protein
MVGRPPSLEISYFDLLRNADTSNELVLVEGQ